MALHPPPTIENNLVLVAMPFTHTTFARVALVTFSCNNFGAPASALALANTIDTDFKTAMAGGIDTDVTLGPAKITWGNGTTTPRVATSSNAPSSGTRAEASAPPNCNILAQKLTGFGGRKNRGRMFIPWSFDKANLDETGQLSAGEVTGMNGRLTALLTALAASSCEMVISNKTFAGSPPFVTNITTGPDVTALVAQSLIASQRRRIGR